MASFLMILGIVLFAVTVCAWRGLYRSWAPFAKYVGNLYVPLAPIGLGVVTVGLSGLMGIHLLAFVGAMIMMVGVLAYVWSPTWLWPPWYGAQYPNRFREK